MPINIDFTVNIPVILCGILAWGIIGMIAYRYYRNQTERPQIWKVLVVLCVGLFSFSIDWQTLNTVIKIPILPLGVWILYWIFHKKENRWETYRSFAWLGFWGNFIFLLSTFIAVWISSVLYPLDDPSTYISNVEKATVIQTHPSGQDGIVLNENLLERLQTVTQEPIYSEAWYMWYMETHMNADENNKERFPYQLIGASPKFGSNVQSIIYIEEDGKGLLIMTPKKQFYFRSQDTLLGGGK